MTMFHTTIQTKAKVTEHLSGEQSLLTITSGQYKGHEMKIRHNKYNLNKPSLGAEFDIQLEIDSTTDQPIDVVFIDAEEAAKAQEQPILYEEVELPEVEEGIRKSDLFYISEPNIKRLNILASIMRDEGYGNALILGPSGWGKTEIGRVIADMLGLRHVRVPMPLITVAEEFFGSRAFDQRTEFILHSYIDMMEEGDVVMTLDEVTRVEQFKLGPIFPILDGDRATTILNHEITVGPNTMFVMTANIGFKYTGTEELDEAFLNRAQSILYIDDIPKKEEVALLQARKGVNPKMADEIADFMLFLRKYSDEVDASIRMSMFLADHMKYGATMLEAVETLIFNRRTLSEESQKDILDAIKARN